MGSYQEAELTIGFLYTKHIDQVKTMQTFLSFGEDLEAALGKRNPWYHFVETALFIPGYMTDLISTSLEPLWLWHQEKLNVGKFGKLCLCVFLILIH